jgi:hypothetical protein
MYLLKDRNEIKRLKEDFFLFLSNYPSYWSFGTDKYEMKMDPFYISYDVKKKVLSYNSPTTNGLVKCKLNTDVKIQKLIREAKNNI